MSEVIGRVIDSSIAAWIADIIVIGGSPGYIDGKVNLLWNYEAIQDASIIALEASIGGATKLYVDGSLAFRDTSILWLQNNKQNNIVDRTFIKEVSLGTDFHWNAGVLAIDISLLPLGPIGPQGSTGLSGTTPIKGIDYFDGSQGIPGINGINGLNGIDGYSPIKNIDYFDGSQGIPGINGTDGINGIDGSQGILGVTGVDGAAGLNGTNGIDGSQGIAGINGLDGSQGIPGINGTDGSTPIKGLDYFDGSLGLQGIQGVPGIDGSQGNQGISGVDGSQGISGLDGTNGINGIDGSQGIQGSQGIPGETGINGTNGLDGSQGLSGIDGYSPIKGLDYFDGSQGISGIDGLDGTNGINGIDGSQGIPGVDGTNGIDGSQGIQGIQGIPGLINDASAGYGLFWNAGLLDVSVSGSGVSKLYVDGSLSTLNSSVGTAGFIKSADLNPYATNASVGNAHFLKEASLGNKFYWDVNGLEPSSGSGDVTKLYVDGSLSQRDVSIAWNTAKNIQQDASLNDQINLEGIFLKEVSIGTGFNWNAGHLDVSSAGSGVSKIYVDGSLSTLNSSVNTALGAYATNASIGTASFAKNASLALYELATTLDTSFGLYYTKTQVDTSFGLYATNASIGAAAFIKIGDVSTSVSIMTDVSNNYAKKLGGFTPVTSTYSVSASDNNGFVLVDVSALTITFPNTLSAGFSTVVVNETTGICTLNASTLLSQDSSIVLRDRYAAATVICKSTGVFLAIGNLK